MEYYPQSSLSQGARQNFVKKVYSVLSVQMLVTVLMIYASQASRSFYKFQMTHTWAFWVSLIGSIVSLIALFKGSITRSYPTNFVTLGLFTLFESYLVSFYTAAYTFDSVILAGVATLAATIGITFYAMTTKQDFTSYGFVIKGAVNSLFWISFVVGIINAFFIKSNLITMGFAAIFAIVYSLYILIDTQLILGGKNHQISLDDYILGSVILYVDIISLFLKILRLLGKKKDQ